MSNSKQQAPFSSKPNV